MSEITHEIDANFAGRLNILRAGVLGANDGIISIAGVVIGVASATSNLWIIFLSGLSAILARCLLYGGWRIRLCIHPKGYRRSRCESGGKPFWTAIQKLHATPSMLPIFKMENVKQLLKS